MHSLVSWVEFGLQSHGIGQRHVDGRVPARVHRPVDQPHDEKSIAAQPDRVTGHKASLAVGDQRIPLTFIGAARSLREQALPLTFAAEGEALAFLAVGQPVEVFVQSRSTQQGVSVPAASVLKNSANQTIVWVKTAPERFESRTVTIAPLDGVNIAVTSGLEAGERVASRAATLINQIR